MARHHFFMDGVAKLARERYGEQQKERIIEKAMKRYWEICDENLDGTRELRQHTHRYIFPAIAVFEAATEVLENREEAQKLVYDFYTTACEKPARWIRKILKVPGLYRLMPSLMRRMAKKNFGAAAGFACREYPKQRGEFQVDMVECPYLTACRRYDCIEIVPAFCAADDVIYGDMHAKLKWGRTKTLGNDADCCDFKLTVE